MAGIVVSELVSRYTADTDDFEAGNLRVRDGLADTGDSADEAASKLLEVGNAAKASASQLSLLGGHVASLSGQAKAASGSLSGFTKAFDASKVSIYSGALKGLKGEVSESGNSLGKFIEKGKQINESLEPGIKAVENLKKVGEFAKSSVEFLNSGIDKLRGVKGATDALKETTTAAEGAKGALAGVSGVYTALFALAAVPIIITVKAVYDYAKDVANQTRATNDYADRGFGVADYLKGRRLKGTKETTDQLMADWKKTYRYKQDQASWKARQPKQPDPPKPPKPPDMPKVAPTHGGGGGGRASRGESEAQRAVEKNKEDIYELNKALFLKGNESDSAGLAYDIAHHHLDGLSKGLAENKLQLTIQKEAMDRSWEAARNYADVLNGVKVDTKARQDELYNATHADMRDQFAHKAFGVDYADLTKKGMDPKMKVEIDAQYAAWKALDEIQWKAYLSEVKFDDGSETVARNLEKRNAAIAEQMQRLAAWNKQVEVSIARADKATAKSDAHDDASARRAFIEGGVGDAASKFPGGFGVAGLVQEVGMLQALSNALGRQFDAQKSAEELRNYTSAMKGLNKEMAGFTRQTTEARVANLAMEDGVRKMTDDQARSVVAMQDQIAKLTQLRDQTRQVASAIAGDFVSATQSVMERGFKGVWGRLLLDARRTVQQMLLELERAKLQGALEKILNPRTKKAPLVGGQFGGPWEAIGKALGGDGGSSTKQLVMVNHQLVDANVGVIDAIDDWIEFMGGTRSSSSTGAAGISSVASVLSGASGGSGVAGVLGSLVRSVPGFLSLFGVGGGGGAGSAPPGGWAHFYADGGNYSGGPMWVGERGPELLWPQGSGTITPNDRITVGDGGDQHIHTHVHLPPGGPIDRRTIDQVHAAAFNGARAAAARFR